MDERRRGRDIGDRDVDLLDVDRQRRGQGGHVDGILEVVGVNRVHMDIALCWEEVSLRG